jgi:hypothetical protein
MTQRNTEVLSFSRLANRRLEADFSGGSLTSDAGALLLREADKRLGLLDALDQVIPDPRHPDLILHSQRSLLAQRVLGIALGYEDLNDHSTLRHDPFWQALAECALDPDRPLASAPTLCRLENRVHRRALFQMAAVLVKTFIDSFDEPPESLVLDFDATDDPVHGHQEGRFFHGYYDGYCFLPLYVFCGDQLLVAYLRTADGDAARHSRAVLKLLVARLRQAWPGVRIIMRADSGFCRWRLMRWCDSNGIGYVLGLARNVVLQRLAWDEIGRAERQFGRTGVPQRIFGSFSYAAGSWDRRRRVIAEAEHGARGANPRFVVTDVPGDPQELYEDVYCQRGEMEDRIEGQQLGLFADRTSCHRSLADQFRLLSSSAAYVVIRALRREALAGTELARARVGTIRLKRFKVAARVLVTARRVVFHLASGDPDRAAYRGALERLMARPRPLGGTG